MYDEDDWFPGKITAIDGEPGETQYYDVLYDDGDEEFALPMRRLRLPERDESENPFKKITRKHRLRGHFEVNEAGIRVKAYTVTVVRYAVSEIVSADKSDVFVTKLLTLLCTQVFGAVCRATIPLGRWCGNPEVEAKL